MNPLGWSGKQRVLVIAAHPDDEVLGCGGAMARHADDGDPVDLVIMGEGITARDPARNQQRSHGALTALQKDLRRASAVLGVRRLAAHAFPDNRFDSVPRLDLIKIVEQEIALTRPTVVYTHHPDDLNIDHRCLADAVQAALRPLPGVNAVMLLAFEVGSSTEYQSSLRPGSFRPNVYLEIDDVLERKCKAMEAYRSERRDYPHPRSSKAIRITAARNGLEVGLLSAERFALVRTVTLKGQSRKSR